MLWYDSETFSTVEIKHGTYKYCENCEVMLIPYALNDEDFRVWDRTLDPRMPDDLAYWLLDTEEPVYASNAMFDRNALRLGDMKLEIPIERWRCGMVRCLAHALPGGLDAQCEVLNLPAEMRKKAEGKKHIQLFCKPHKTAKRYGRKLVPIGNGLYRATRDTHPEEWAVFVEYAKYDGIAMREVSRRTPTWNYDPYAQPGDTHPGAQELQLWHLDQRINDRGFRVDLELAHAAVRAVDRAKERLASRTQDITEGEVESTTKRDQLLAHILREHGVDLPDMQMSTLERRLSDPSLPRAVHELLSIRLQASSTSTSKYTALLKGVSSDGRLRGTLQYDGAGRTRRHAGRTFQPQNLPSKGLPPYAEIEAGIAAMKGNYEDLVYA